MFNSSRLILPDAARFTAEAHCKQNVCLIFRYNIRSKNFLRVNLETGVEPLRVIFIPFGPELLCSEELY